MYISLKSVICRYKLLSQSIGKELYVLCLYFKKKWVIFYMCTLISMYLFHILVHIGLRQVSLCIGWLFSRMKGLFACSNYTYKWLWIKYCNVRIGASVGTLYRFAIELAYSHNVLCRLFLGFMQINAVFVLMSLCISLVLGINSFYYEYSSSWMGRIFALPCYDVLGLI